MAHINHQQNQLSLPMVVISDYTQQDKYAVAVFTDAIIKKIKENYPTLSTKRIIFLSDGTGTLQAKIFFVFRNSFI